MHFLKLAVQQVGHHELQRRCGYQGATGDVDIVKYINGKEDDQRQEIQQLFHSNQAE